MLHEKRLKSTCVRRPQCSARTASDVRPFGYVRSRNLHFSCVPGERRRGPRHANALLGHHPALGLLGPLFSRSLFPAGVPSERFVLAGVAWSLGPCFSHPPGPHRCRNRRMGHNPETSPSPDAGAFMGTDSGEPPNYRQFVQGSFPDQSEGPQRATRQSCAAWGKYPVAPQAVNRKRVSQYDAGRRKLRWIRVLGK
jgi:hypothetical protein